jgi:hypothetical protein
MLNIAGLLDAGLEDALLAAQSLGSLAQLVAQVSHITATDVPEFDPFEIAPDPLGGVQLGRIARQPFEVQPLRPSSGQKVFDFLAAMDRGAIPHHQQLARKVAQEMLQKANHPRAAKGLGLHLQMQLALRGEGADDRQVVVAQAMAQDRRLALGGVGAHDGGQQVEPGFIHPDQGALFVAGFFSRAANVS